MSSSGKSRKREAFLAALLASPTVKAAAESVGISISTATRWQRDPEFSREYRRMKGELLSAAMGMLVGSSGAAVAALVRIIESRRSSAAAKVQAATKLLSLALQDRELDGLEERIAALERVGGE